MTLNKDIIFKAEIFASRVHNGVNHLYDNQSYTHHLKMAVIFGEKFIHLIPQRNRANVLAALWLHDTIEDARVTYNAIKELFNKDVAEYVFALTNCKGRNRAERASDKYYKGILDFKHSSFIKLCDRLANVQHGKNTKSSMFKKYKKEQVNFRNKLDDGRFSEMWDELETLLK